ncbi:MAG: phosphotransferase [Actinobacteria bacterium]|nr:phosphotransferase [Actinomycetota bacterium]
MTGHDDVEVLLGGVGNAGAVVRIGANVLRPTSEHSPAIHALLRHLEAAGFGGAPRLLGVEADGRERLGFIDGEVPLPPFPDWSLAGAVLASIAALLRRFHDATTRFVVPAGASWSAELADPAPGNEPVLCHNDVCLENVVFRDAAAVALLDFEFAAPGRRVWDVAAMARMCVPIDTDDDAARIGRRGLDPFTRLRVAADAYGLDSTQRVELVDALTTQVEQRGDFVRRRVEAGDDAFIAMWEAMGGQARYDRRAAWFAARRDAFLAALA